MNMFRGSMVAIVTPMNEDGSIDFISLKNLVEFHIENQTDVIISVGTTENLPHLILMSTRKSLTKLSSL